jgi:hypothetical protein
LRHFDVEDFAHCVLLIRVKYLHKLQVTVENVYEVVKADDGGKDDGLHVELGPDIGPLVLVHVVLLDGSQVDLRECLSPNREQKPLSIRFDH